MPITDYDKKYLDLYADFKQDYDDGLKRMQTGGHLRQLSAQDREKEQQIKEILAAVQADELKRKADNLLENQHRPMTKMSGNIVVSTYDLDFILALSLQEMDAKQSPESEYRDWIEVSQKIEAAINNNGTTQQEVDARNGFINFLDVRETEMKRVMDLYSSAALHSQGFYREEAIRKLEYMRFKLAELRRLRARMQATKDRSDERERLERAIIERGGRYLSQKIGAEFEDNIIDPATFKPETQNEEEAQKKVDSLRMNSAAFMAMVVMGYRYGKSRQDVEREMQQKRQLDMLPQVPRRRGLTVRDFERVAQRV